LRSILRSLLVVCLLATACAGATAPRAVAQEQPLQIRSAAQPFKIDDPSARSIGRLVWRGGVMLSADASQFGGWSDLHVAPDGTTLTAISDEGAWLTATIDYDGEANLAGLSNARIGQLRGLDGRPIESKAEADAEALARLSDGSWLVAFERRHRLWRYRTLADTPTPVKGPADIGRQPANGGIEALTTLGDGRVVALSEEYSVRPDTVTGWIGTPDAAGGYQWRAFGYATVPDFRPTAIATMPDGSLVVLERAFDLVRGVRCRVMRFDAAQLVPDGKVQAEELARLASPYAVDNLEGIFSTRGARGETLVWLMSDDNFNPLQRNILLLFELAP
jgi:hypothetical protein